MFVGERYVWPVLMQAGAGYHALSGHASLPTTVTAASSIPLVCSVGAIGGPHQSDSARSSGPVARTRCGHTRQIARRRSISSGGAMSPARTACLSRVQAESLASHGKRASRSEGMSCRPLGRGVHDLMGCGCTARGTSPRPAPTGIRRSRSGSRSRRRAWDPVRGPHDRVQGGHRVKYPVSSGDRSSASSRADGDYGVRQGGPSPREGQGKPLAPGRT